jgi:MFS family permease
VTKSSVGGAVASLALCTLLPSLATSSANVALPTLAGAFGASFRQVQWVVLAYLLATTSVIVGAGRFGDVVGRRRLLLAGLIVFVAASVVCAIAPGLGVLVAARVAQGLGAAVMMVLAVALVGESVPHERTGRAMGLLGTASAVGTALGPTLGGLLISTFGWPSIFLVNVPLGVVALVIAQRCLRPDAAADTTAASPSIGPVGGGAAPRRGAAATSALVSMVVMATLVVGPFYLGRGLGLGTAAAGLVMSAGPLSAALTGVPAGRLVDQFGAGRMTLVGLCVMATGCAALAVVLPGIGGYVAPVAMLTAGYALFQTANNTGVLARVAATDRGAISGILNLSRNLGLIAGASVMGGVFSLVAGDLASAGPDEVAAGLRATFGLAAVLVMAGTMLSNAGVPGCRPLVRLER